MFDERSGNLLSGTDDLLRPDWAASNLSIERRLDSFQLTAHPGEVGHKHFSQHVSIEAGRVVTFRVAVRGESCNNVMLQIGDELGYVNASFDVRARKVAAYALKEPRGQNAAHAGRRCSSMLFGFDMQATYLGKGVSI